MTTAIEISIEQLDASPVIKPRLLTWPLIRVLLVSFGAMTSFYLLLALVPMYADANGASAAGAGLATGVLMLSTVGVELVSPALIARFGNRRTVGSGLLLLGVPALALPGSESMVTILAVCLVRGAGFAIVVVVIGAWVAAMAPRERRGEALGVGGVVASVPAVIMLPLGVWLAERVGYSPLFIGGAVTALVGLLAMVGLADEQPDQEQPDTTQPFGMRDGLTSSALLRPAVVFSATAMAAGIVATFLPVALGEASGGLAAIALLTQAAAATIGRWWAGRYGDRHGAAKLLVPSVLVATVGMLGVVLSSPVAVMVGMVLFGAGFGAAQNSSLAVMFDRAPSSGCGTVSAVWSIAYDAGLGLGATGFGVVVLSTGYPAAFALTAGLMLAVLLVVLPRGRDGYPQRG
ncbi:MAG TPA: MFS transporter [Jiangellaceae bacterium]|nr:MFS transporter [Jiangellaceae bacterium]